jgi:ABC-type lipoprotein release transport system permease subunit
MLLSLAWRNLWRNKKRTTITLASIAFAVFFACLMQSMQLGSYERMIDNAVRFYTGHIQIHKNGYWDEKIIDNSFNQAPVQNVLNNIDQIAVSVPRLESFALAAAGDKTKGVFVVGVDPKRENQITDLKSKLMAGNYLAADRDILLGRDLAQYLKALPGDTITLISQGYHGVNAADNFIMKGVLSFPSPELNRQAAYMTLMAAQRFYGAQDLATSLSILLSDPKSTGSVAAAIAHSINMDEHEVMTWKELMPELVQSIELDYYGGLVMLLILYAIIAFGIFGTLLMMTNERRYEFGMLISLGLKRFKLQLMVVIEVFMLGLFGVFSGIIISLPVLLYFYFNPIYFTGDSAKAFENFGFEPILPFSLDPQIFIQQALFVFIITLLLGIYPLSAIRQLKVVEALKQ